MTTELIAYIGRDNEDRLELLQDGVPVVAGAITGAVLRFGDYCLDTDDDPTLAYFLDSDNQTVCFKLGLITGLVTGKYKNGTLTLFDTQIRMIAWSLINVTSAGVGCLPGSVMDRKRITDRLMVSIILKHKERVIDAARMQEDINGIIEDFAVKTGRRIEQIEVEEKNGQYQLKLKVI
jgi:hypothetical protein